MKLQYNITTIKFSLAICMAFCLTVMPALAQNDTIDVRNLTREQVLELPYDKLIEMPLDQLLLLADIVGVSLEELYEMILNKDVVSASKKTESSFEAPLSTSVVSYDEIITSGARTIEEALRLVPGLIVREKTNGNFDVHIRGNDNLPPGHMFVYSENSITLVMINGRPVYNYVHGGTFWETLPIGIEDINRIEVVRGPSSALYGPNAVSGVINIITKDAESKEISVSAYAQAGSLNTQIASVGVGKKLSDKVGLRVTGNYYHADRTTDEFLVLRDKKYVTVDELPVDSFLSSGKYYKTFDPADSAGLMFPDPLLARRNYGGNAYMFYQQAEDVRVDLNAGFQWSDIISSTMGDNPISTVGRISSSNYVDFRADIKNLTAQFNINNGWQDIVKEDTGFKVDVRNINANLEYDINFNKLNIRPGVAYQYASYNDLPYLSYEGQGFLNAERSFNSMAASLRADYNATDKLRLIAALRGEKYNTHADLYFSYQFVAAYSINEQNLVRAVYSRSNRSPFLVDTYANYLWVRDGRPNPGIIQFLGAKNLDLLKMDQIELGYRMKPVKSIQIDIEAFYTKAFDFGALYPDSVNLNLTGRPFAQMSYTNIDLISKQYGISGKLTAVVSKDLYFNLYGTLQKTNLENVIPYNQDQTVAWMFEEAFLLYTSGGQITHATNFPNTRIDQENKSTPTIYGGFLINYRLFDERLNLNLNAYYLGKQVFQNKYGDFDLNPQINLNVKASFKVFDGASVFVNARNLLSNDEEFGFVDAVKPIILGGFHLDF